MPSDVRDSIERGWRELAAIDEAHERGEIDEEGWHEAVAAIVVPAYLGGETPWEQSGRSGDLASWERGRRPIMAAIERDGTFLDIGCANGFLMESIRAWAARKRDATSSRTDSRSRRSSRRSRGAASRSGPTASSSGTQRIGVRRAASTTCAPASTTCRRRAAATSLSTCWPTWLLPAAA
jgi:hypothetical protein